MQWIVSWWLLLCRRFTGIMCTFHVRHDCRFTCLRRCSVHSTCYRIVRYIYKAFLWFMTLFMHSSAEKLQEKSVMQWSWLRKVYLKSGPIVIWNLRKWNWFVWGLLQPKKLVYAAISMFSYSSLTIWLCPFGLLSLHIYHYQHILQKHRTLLSKIEW